MKNEKDEILEFFKLIDKAIKYLHGYYKHMTTLSTGSILIIVTLLGGIFKEPEDIFAIIISILGFVICLVGALMILGVICNVVELIFVMFTEIPELTKEKFPEYLVKYKKKTDSLANVIEIVGPITFCAFLLGVIMLLVFTFINLAKRI